MHKKPQLKFKMMNIFDCTCKRSN